MIGVYCFSGSGHSLAVAEALVQELHCQVCPMEGNTAVAETAVVVFPVYCQNIPSPVKAFLRRLSAKHVALIATYGKISYGNVLQEAQKLLQGQVIAGAYVPMGHSFLDGDHDFDPRRLLPLVQRIQEPKPVVIPKNPKNPLSNVFPALRSRLGVKITKTGHCNGCGQCERNCPMEAIREGRIHGACIRCLRCVSSCPTKALQYKNSRIMDAYLKRYRKEEYVLYL